jgi:acetylcholinesterase
MFTLVFLVSAALLSLAIPTVKLDSAVVTGVTEGSIDKFLGIPFALPP